MRTYLSDNIDSYTEEESIFTHREVTLLHEEKIRIKNAVMETIIDPTLEGFSKREKEYWELHRKGMKNKDISLIMNIGVQTCKNLKYKVSKKIELFGNKLNKNIQKVPKF
ncbi:MAG: helix-turn-helix transcriptional regulator [Cetobacterium sp.]|uniref:helix-turn-helix transcriptional regulator n=1 Tax=Cetobacterium sp. TaxID=2071632 RepID=UPI003EE62F2E